MRDGFRKNGKKLGVIGGMGPAASAEFLRLLTMKAPAETDQEHPVVFMVADTEIPDRSTAIMGAGPDPSEQLYRDFEQLAALGADLFAVPCNTAHYFIDRFEKPLPKPLIHIVEETVLASKAINPKGAWMLSTIGTMQSGLYQSYADKINYALHIPNARQRGRNTQSIIAVKANHFTRRGNRPEHCYRAVGKSLTCRMTACTESLWATMPSGLPGKSRIKPEASLLHRKGTLLQIGGHIKNANQALA
jgi:aspartate racemase